MVVSSSFCVWKKKSVVSAPIYRPVRLTFFTLYFVVQIHISQTFTPFSRQKPQSMTVYSILGPGYFNPLGIRNDLLYILIISDIKYPGPTKLNMHRLDL